MISKNVFIKENNTMAFELCNVLHMLGNIIINKAFNILNDSYNPTKLCELFSLAAGVFVELKSYSRNSKANEIMNDLSVPLLEIQINICLVCAQIFYVLSDKNRKFFLKSVMEDLYKVENIFTFNQNCLTHICVVYKQFVQSKSFNNFPNEIISIIRNHIKTAINIQITMVGKFRTQLDSNSQDVGNSFYKRRLTYGDLLRLFV